MFRRRTDQVYATLQQVQRRITEQAGTQPGTSVEATPASGFAPLNDLVARPPAVPLVARQPEPPPVPATLGQGMRGTGDFTISKSFAVTLIVLWLATDVLFYVFGHYQEGRAHGHGDGYASGDPGNRPASGQAGSADESDGAGSYVIVLESVDDASPDNIQHLNRSASDLNKIMIKNAALGWKPWFGVRQPENGQLQLVYGETSDGVFGIARSKLWEDFAQVMREKPPKGAGYAEARWMQVPKQ